MAGARSRTHIMLKRMCSTPPCSHAALRTVHQRPYPKTGTAPLAPKRKRLCMLGEKKDSIPSRAHALEVGGERGEVESAAGPHHEAGEAHVVADVAQEVGEAPHPGVAPAAGEALRVTHPDEGSARRAENGRRAIHGTAILAVLSFRGGRLAVARGICSLSAGGPADSSSPGQTKLLGMTWPSRPAEAPRNDMAFTARLRLLGMTRPLTGHHGPSGKLLRPPVTPSSPEGPSE